MQEEPQFVLRVRIGKPEWFKVGWALEKELGPYCDYYKMVEWFRSQKAQFAPESDLSLHYYSLVFENQTDLTEFVLKWL